MKLLSAGADATRTTEPYDARAEIRCPLRGFTVLAAERCNQRQIEDGCFCAGRARLEVVAELRAVHKTEPRSLAQWRAENTETVAARRIGPVHRPMCPHCGDKHHNGLTRKDCRGRVTALRGAGWRP